MDSILDEKFTLHDLLDPGVVREVCAAYVKAFGLGVAILDESGREQVCVCPPQEFCKDVQAGVLENKCRDAKARLARHHLEGPRVFQLKSGCGMRYTLFPLSYQLEILGRVIIGPFRDPDTPPDKIGRLPGGDAEATISREKIEAVPAISPERLKLAVSLLAKTLNAFLFINAKRLITTRLHLDTIYGQREQIFKQVELQDSGSPEDKAEIEKLKNMF